MKFLIAVALLFAMFATDAQAGCGRGRLRGRLPLLAGRAPRMPRLPRTVPARPAANKLRGGGRCAGGVCK